MHVSKSLIHETAGTSVIYGLLYHYHAFYFAAIYHCSPFYAKYIYLRHGSLSQKNQQYLEPYQDRISSC